MLMRKTAALLLLSLPLALARPMSTLAQAPVQYNVAFPNAVHHEARVTATFRELPAGPLQVRMARSSPGRYALHEFAKNVYDVAATDSRGRALTITRPDPSGWAVTGHDGTVTFTYTLFGDRTDGTYAGIDARHAHLNIPATLAYAEGLEQRPAQVQFAGLPAAWTVATQLQPDAAGTTYSAPNLQYLMDSPTSLGEQQVRTWQEGGRTIELKVLHEGTPAELDAYAAQTQKIVREAAAVFGGMPAFDFGRYTFVANYLPQTSSDGMEHRNSTSLTSRRPLRGPGAIDNLGTVAHEFFHAWNVERLRPQDLEPFNFSQANISSNLWFAEGFTQYYGELVLRRAGIYPTDTEYCQEALTGLVNAMMLSPGAARFSPVQMSQQAPFVDAAAAIDPNNRTNTYLSYYYIGAANALALDLELRARFKTDLDTYMRALWQQFGSQQQNYAPARPYTTPDLQRVLGEVARDTAFAGQFFRQHIYGHQQPDYPALLAPAGLLVRPARPNKASLATRLSFNAADSTATLGTTTSGSPLYVAGLDREDVVLRFDGQRLVGSKAFEELLSTHRPGDVVQLEVRTRTGLQTVPVTLTEEPALEVVTYEAAGRPISKAQKKFRAAWLSSKVR
ncbi:M61 family metallopeptidase [Hymenobacter psychrophilus]|uniref:Predicted metalloprotease, contains C-terminal PDZ domain n=1 Tax=Hymenobacter psychrophilus TaxID=651662 RepID=A0A1H3GTA9_9BACT|nr:PDZ domain-containing protein [Hymenobacter psychrophilus]SDY06566.1 Predicted metalloprotease, contains C-terminal PDZ domain [Hymenobacter psychrophilus]